MKNALILFRSLAFFFVLAFASVLNAQETNPVSDSIQNRLNQIVRSSDLGTVLPPLNVLIDTALVHSPELNYYDSRIKVREYEISMAKKSWTNDVILGANVNYGSFGSVAVDDISIGQQYTFGVRMPLSTIFTRNERIGMAESWLETEVHKREEARRMVQDQVIELYNKLFLIRRLLEIQSEAKESAELIKEMGDIRFMDGELSIEDMGTTTELRAKYNSQYEELRTEFSNHYFRLERLVGVPFSKFEKSARP
jgi:outer membrane protein TolC